MCWPAGWCSCQAIRGRSWSVQLNPQFDYITISIRCWPTQRYLHKCVQMCLLDQLGQHSGHWQSKSNVVTLCQQLCAINVDNPHTHTGHTRRSTVGKHGHTGHTITHWSGLGTAWQSWNKHHQLNHSSSVVHWSELWLAHDESVQQGTQIWPSWALNTYMNMYEHPHRPRAEENLELREDATIPSSLWSIPGQGMYQEIHPCMEICIAASVRIKTSLPAFVGESRAFIWTVVREQESTVVPWWVTSVKPLKISRLTSFLSDLHKVGFSDSVTWLPSSVTAPQSVFWCPPRCRWLGSTCKTITASTCHHQNHPHHQNHNHHHHS